MYLLSTVSLKMSNGSILSGIYSKRDQKIYEFMSLINKHDIRPYDKLLFVYSGEGCFKVHIFSASRVEKPFNLNPVEIGKDSCRMETFPVVKFG